MDILYTAEALATGGGRNGHVRTTDGILDTDVRVPKEMGGAGGAPNPELLFAAGYAACFHSALQSVARAQKVAIAQSWSGVVGLTVHGMPQIGQLQPGVWVLGGFGRQGLNTTAIGGALVARGLAAGDEGWRLFSPFELVWAGGSAGRIAGQAVMLWSRGQAAAAGTLSRYRERARAREQERERARQARMAAMQARAAAASAMSRDDRDGATGA